MRRQAKAPSAFSFTRSRLVASLVLICLLALPGIAAGAPGPPAPNHGARAYELVSPPNKVSGNGVGVPPDPSNPNKEQARAGGGGAPAYVGERFAVGAQLGAVMLDGAFATSNDWAFAERVSDETGWHSHSPVTHPFRCANDYRMQQLQQASPDFSTVLWTGNAGSLPFFEQMCALNPSIIWPTLVSDWGDPPVRPARWEPIGPLATGQIINPLGVPVRVFFVPAVSADGTHLAVSGAIRGLAGPGDPTIDTIGSVLGNTPHSAYVDDISAGLSDSWPGNGVRTPAAACTGGGSGEQARTEIPVRNADGSIGALGCAAPTVGRDSRLVSSYGSIITRVSGGTEVGTSNTNVISADGSRTFFMAPDPDAPSNTGRNACTSDTGPATRCPAQLYVRQENSDGEVVTRWLSRPEPGQMDDPGQAALLGPAYFEGASADGSVVFFRTDSPLTADDPNGRFQPSPDENPNYETERGETSWDLYMAKLAPGADPTGAGFELTRVTAGPNGTSDCSTQPAGLGNNSAALRFASEDGTRVYFTCAAPLGGVADRPTGTAAGTQAGTPSTTDQTNIYLYDANVANPAERYTFVARIPYDFDGGSVVGGVIVEQEIHRCASAAALRGAPMHPNGYNRLNCWRGTADGAFATFWTLGRLTSDDPDELSPAPSADIYAYDAGSDELTRVSGPQGSVDETYVCNGATTPIECYADQGLHSGTEQSTANPLLNVVTSPATPGDRILYFESKSRLIDADQNQVFDVYEWRNGDLSLVTSGAPDSAGSAYKGNSADGKNVYFMTADRLTWQDVDSVADIYTARAGSQGIPEPVPPVLCEVLNDACQSPAATAPGASGAASTAFAGAGNVASSKRRKCRKGRVRRGAKCVKRKSAKRKAAKQKNRKRVAHQAGRTHR